MFSLVKLALFSFIAFATLALAIPSPVSQPNGPAVVIVNANTALDATLRPLCPSIPFYASLDFCSLPLIRLR